MVKDVVVRVQMATRESSEAPVLCQECQSELDMHQPNLHRPEEMLGICHTCGEWHFVRASENDPSLVIALLPVHGLPRVTTGPASRAVAARRSATMQTFG